jgi:hypothetical protein
LDDWAFRERREKGIWLGMRICGDETSLDLDSRREETLFRELESGRPAKNETWLDLSLS